MFKLFFTGKRPKGYIFQLLIFNLEVYNRVVNFRPILVPTMINLYDN